MSRVQGVPVALLFVFASSARAQQLPPPPVPPENPITEAKRILGKMLFWEEQVSSHDTISCGGCHRPASGGSDPRIGANPGPDGIVPSADDISGSPGVVRTDASGAPIADPVFGFGVQVTGRAANSFIMAAFVPEAFWDGRARSTFLDPETGALSIASGGALESQAVAPILSHVEMAIDGRTWSDVRAKLEHSLPLRDATDLPADLQVALSDMPSYRSLFKAAFGDPTITGERIAFAIASYERTLVPDQSPWDRYIAGDTSAMTPTQAQGWSFFRSSPCVICHPAPMFTNQSFRNIGIRPPAEDPGRKNVTGLDSDRGKFKVPSLRNTGLKPTHMHTGRILTITDAVRWYRSGNPDRSTDNLDPSLPFGVPQQLIPAVVEFLTNGLTDPRVAAESAPFDRPTIHGGALPALSLAADRATLSWPSLEGIQAYYVYRGDIAGLRIAGPDGLPVAGYGSCLEDPSRSDTLLVDPESPAPGHGFFYLKSVVDRQGAERGLGATSDGRARRVLVSCKADADE